MIKIALVDDESVFLESFRKKLEQEVYKQEINCNIVTFQNSSDFFSHTDEYNVIFLDIEMPSVSGKDIAMKIKEKNSKPLVIFVTNFDDFVFSAFKYQPFDFIRKRFINKELPDVVAAISEYFQKKDYAYTFTFNYKGKLITLNQHNIVYFEAFNHKIYIHTVEKQYAVNEPLSKIEKKISENFFVKIHKSYLVNIEHIFSVDKEKVILYSNKALPLSRHRVNEVKQKIITASER